jgi:2'-5' RNA ligase
MTRRLFFGTWLDDAARGAAIAAQVAVREANPEAVLRWTPPANMHLTLRFLGGTDEAHEQALVDAVDRLHARWWSSSIAGEQVEAWATVVVSVLRPSTGVRGIAADLEALARETGFPPEERDFTPHVTIARGKASRGFVRVEMPMELQCDHVALIESHGGRYLERRRWQLPPE